VAGEIIGSNSRASMRTNSKLALEDNVLSKWHEQGALCSESTGLKIHSEIDSKIYEIKITGNPYANREAQYIQLLQLESSHQITGPLH